MWRQRAEKLEEHKKFLKQQVASLQRCLESKFFELAVQQDRPASKNLLPALPMSEDTKSMVEVMQARRSLFLNIPDCGVAPCLSAAQPQKETMVEERPRNITHLGQFH
ncbi:uncharacterized protein LOC119159813 [Rhipicephalus microplus]|uniref:uncharacterized protein LOC119159813 n=1 Tax=Rhipicephalus microplus TaxID=6941 RepID=UPI003F6CE105